VAVAQLNVAALGDGAAALAAQQAAFQSTQEQLLAASSNVLAGQTGACMTHNATAVSVVTVSLSPPWTPQ
jgi:hypothetical protein